MARCSIGKNKKRRKFLQDSAPANWEQYGTELSPLIQKSEKISESQWEILENFGKNEAQDSSDVREYKNPDYREDVFSRLKQRLSTRKAFICAELLRCSWKFKIYLRLN